MVLSEVDRLKKDKDVDGLHKMLNSKMHGDDHMHVINALNKLEDERVELLINAVNNSSDHHVVESSLTSLGEIGNLKAIEFLITQLNSDYHRYQTRAGHGLSNCGKKAVKPLLNALDGDLFVKDNLGRELAKCHAIHILGKIGDPKAVDPLIELLKDENYEVKAAAAHALADIRDSRAVGST